eukprot:scaffold7237_cov137-Isochrysis_galbana.AAC.2
MVKWTAAGFTAAAILLSIAARSHVPNPMPIHWNASGQPDGYASRVVSLSLLPVLMGIMTLLLHVPTKIVTDDGKPRRSVDVIMVVDDGRSRQNVDAVMVACTGIMLAVHVLIVLTSLEGGQAISTA